MNLNLNQNEKLLLIGGGIVVAGIAAYEIGQGTGEGLSTGLANGVADLLPILGVAAIVGVALVLI